MRPALGEGGFEPYVHAVRRHPLIVLVVTLAALAGATAWIVARSSHYRATAELLVTPAPFNDITYTGLPIVRDTSSDPTRAIETAAALIDSPEAGAGAARLLGPGWTSSRVSAVVTVVPMGGTNVLEVQAVSGQPGVAARTANAFVSAALAQRRQSLRPAAAALIARLKAAPTPPPRAELSRLLSVAQGFDPTFAALHAATAPRSPIGAAAWRVLSVVLFAGLVLGVGAALLTDVVLGRRRSEAEVVELAVRGVASRSDAPRP